MDKNIDFPTDMPFSVLPLGIVKVGIKGQVMIPKAVRDAMNIKPGDDMIARTRDGFEVVSFIKAKDFDLMIKVAKNFVKDNKLDGNNMPFDSKMRGFATVSSKGHIVIPQILRKEYGFETGDRLVVLSFNEEIQKVGKIMYFKEEKFDEMLLHFRKEYLKCISKSKK